MDGRLLDNRELQREMQRYRSVIFNTYVQELQITNTSNFWNTEFDGITPLKRLEEKALDALKRLKVQENMLKQKNLWPYGTYEDLLKDRIMNNEKRRIAVKKNEVIYGPVEFSERTFFDYQFSNAVIKLKKLMEGKEIPVSEKLLIAYFERKKKDVFAGKEYNSEQVEKQVKAHYIEDRYELFVDSLSQRSIIELIR